MYFAVSFSLWAKREVGMCNTDKETCMASHSSPGELILFLLPMDVTCEGGLVRITSDSATGPCSALPGWAATAEMQRPVKSRAGPFDANHAQCNVNPTPFRVVYQYSSRVRDHRGGERSLHSGQMNRGLRVPR